MTKPEYEMITCTKDFKQAITEDRVEEAEKWFHKVKSRPNYDDEWCDHRERELFQGYYGRKDWPNAKRIVENSIWPSSKQGRIKRLEQLSGILYEDIPLPE